MPISTRQSFDRMLGSSTTELVHSSILELSRNVTHAAFKGRSVEHTLHREHRESRQPFGHGTGPSLGTDAVGLKLFSSACRSWSSQLSDEIVLKITTYSNISQSAILSPKLALADLLSLVFPSISDILFPLDQSASPSPFPANRSHKPFVDE